MILLRSGLLHILKVSCALGLCLACVLTFLLSYAFITGDRVDREDMKRTADHYASYLRLVPHADAAPARLPASR